MLIKDIILKYYSQSTKDKHHRFKSWEHCYQFFLRNFHDLENERVFDHACLHLAFYLASWGMLRGSSFLLFKDYKVHKYFIKDVVMNPDFEGFLKPRSNELIDADYFTHVDSLMNSTRNSYLNKIKEVNGIMEEINITDTLTSKILLGVFGNVPAYDRFFKKGVGLFGIKMQLDPQSLEQLRNFYNHFIGEFSECKKMIDRDGIHYTPMKLIDMFFWQVGFMLESQEASEVEINEIIKFADEYKVNKYKTKSRPRLNFSNKTTRPGLTNEIRRYISTILDSAVQEGYGYVDIKSGEVHNKMGLKNRFPAVCNAMVSLDNYKDYKILEDTPSGKSSTKLIRYYL